MTSPELKERLGFDGAEPVTNSPEEFHSSLKREIAKWPAVIKATNVRID